MAYYPWSLMGRANMQKRQQFKKNLLLYSHTLEKTKGMVMIPMNCEIHNPESGVQNLGWGQCDHIVKCIKSLIIFSPTPIYI